MQKYLHITYAFNMAVPKNSYLMVRATANHMYKYFHLCDYLINTFS